MSTTRRPAWRFSIRTLLVLFTIFAVILALLAAPIGKELSWAYLVQRQARELEAAGCEIGFSDRPGTYSLWLTRSVWPWRVSRLGEEVYKIRVHQGKPFDITTLQRFPSAEDIHLSLGSTICSDPEFRAPEVLFLSYEAGSGAQPSAEPELRLLKHFPNVLILELWNLPADSLHVLDFAACPKLTRLHFSLSSPSEPKSFDVSPLRGLTKIETLAIAEMPENTDWSFLQDMSELQGALINPQGPLNTSAAGHARYANRAPANHEQTPLHHVARLPRLTRLELNGTPAYAADLALLAEHSRIGTLRLERIPEGPKALASLKQAPHLHELHIYVSQFDDLAELARELNGLKQLRMLSCEFHTFTIEHVAMLEQLSNLVALDILVDQYLAGSDGLTRLSNLPLHRFNGPYNDADCSKLHAIAVKKATERLMLARSKPPMVQE